MSKVLKTYRDLEATRESVVCLGNFDGFHLGHQEAARMALREASKRGASSILYTFHPHPRSVLQNGGGPSLLFTIEEKKELLAKLGFDILIFEDFTLEFSQMTAEDFVQKVLVDSLKAVEISVGQNFRFGNKAKGNAQLIRSLSSIQVAEVDFIRGPEDQVVSSSRVRELIQAGQIERANAMLGYPYFMTGEVVRGDSRGRELGFATANLASTKLCRPQDGVYFGVVEDLKTNLLYSAVYNIGSKPTFGKNRVAIEAHFIDFDDNLYGRDLRYFFLGRLRGETAFAGVDELKAQIKKDVQEGQSHLKAMKILQTENDQEPYSLQSFDVALQDFQAFENFRRFLKQ